MADTPAPKPAAKGGPVGGLTRKLGPLPVWAWAIIGLAVGYYVYEHYLKGATTPAATTPATTANPVPGSDQSTGGASTSGGIGSTDTTTPPAGTENNGKGTSTNSISLTSESAGPGTSSGNSGISLSGETAGASAGFVPSSGIAAPELGYNHNLPPGGTNKAV